MRYFKLATSDEESRWINLAQVSRVTLAPQAGHGGPVLAVFFADAAGETKLEIQGSTPQNRKAIEKLAALLDTLVG